MIVASAAVRALLVRPARDAHGGATGSGGDDDNNNHGDRTRPKLIVVLVQGVRADYVDHEVHTGFERLARAGVRAEYVLPVFPSSPYPNAYSIATGT